MLMNDTFVLDQAAAVAARIEREAPAGRAHRIARLWQLVYGQEPTAEETAQAIVFLRDNADLGESKALASLVQVLINSNRFLYIE